MTAQEAVQKPVETAPPVSQATPAQDFRQNHPTDFELSDHAVDEVKSLKVAVIGAGLTGIIAGVLLNAKVPNIQLTIFEKNADVVSGVRCDVPAHVYQATFSPNTQWSEEFAQGPEILAYWQGLARKYDVYSYVRLNTRVTAAHWHAPHWRLSVGDEIEEFDFVITAIGIFNTWKMPNIPGMDEFEGVLRHSSNWDASFDPRGKRIATIGNGASGMQLTAALAKMDCKIDHYARSKTWIAGSWNPNTKERLDTVMPISDEDRKRFEDPKEYLVFRKEAEDKFFRDFHSYLVGTEKSKAARKLRLTPGPGYLEALSQDNVTLIQEPIKRFTRTGIEAGSVREVDAIFCSTGAEISYAPPFPIVSGEYDLHRDWKRDGKIGWPRTYLGIGCPDFPNLAFALGPAPAGPSGTVPHTVEVQITYIAKMLRKMSQQRIKTMVPSRQATDDFVAYSDAFFPLTNMSQNCSSWANGGIPGARIHGYWPGSAAAVTRIRREPRWEDFEYEYDKERFSYWGNGRTMQEYDEESDMTKYLRLDEENDLRDLHERWWDL